MNGQQLRRDLEYLAGVLPHRGSNTKSERSAAEYLAGRFRDFSLDVELDDFHSVDSEWLLYALYFSEFAVVAIIAAWWPLVAFGYGLFIFLCYLAESTGYRLFGRFLPQYDSQNVVCRFVAPKPRRLCIVTAHYDSPRDSPLQSPRVRPWLRLIQLFLVFCMMLVIVSCAVQGFGLFDSLTFPYDIAVRWTAVSCLLCAAAFLVFTELSCDYGRGAWNNASGTAVLLELVRRFSGAGLEQTDLWFVATGSKEAGLNGMRHFMSAHQFDPASTFFLNIDSVGAPRLHYVIAEGILSTLRSSRVLVSAAEQAAQAFLATPVQCREFHSDALLPLTRGFHGLTLTSSYETPPEDRLLSDDTHLDVRDSALLAASGLAEAILRRVDALPGAGP